MLRSLLPLMLLTACAEDTTLPGDDQPSASADCDHGEAVAWTEGSHAKGVPPDYERIFGDGQVLRMDITLCAADYALMQEDLEALMSSGGGPGSGGPGGGGGADSDEDPIYVPAMLSFEGATWPWVGVRYKGNSSLDRGYRDGSLKLPFRIDFDRYEDEVPATDNQRFWGFKELKFNSAFDDASLIRDKLTADTFRDAGIPAARGAFVEVHVDVGDGPVFWGLYTVFEEPCDELPEDWFGDGDGDCYKADGDAADLDSFDAESFENKSNDDGDHADVIALVDALAAAEPGSAAWRAELEATLNVADFLRYQALNGLIGNWDTYGKMTHNYYLYNDPAEGRLYWVPWDFNESYRREGTQGPLSIDLGEVDDSWPLIRHTMDDPEYRQAYLDELEDLMNGVFAEDAQRARMEAYLELVAPYAAQEEAPYTNLSSYGAFEDALDGRRDGLMTVVTQGHAEAEALLEAR